MLARGSRGPSVAAVAGRRRITCRTRPDIARRAGAGRAGALCILRVASKWRGLPERALDSAVAEGKTGALRIWPATSHPMTFALALFSDAIHILHPTLAGALAPTNERAHCQCQCQCQLSSH